MSFPDHGVNRKVVDNVKHYINMKFQQKLMTRSRENGQKPDFLQQVSLFHRKALFQKIRFLAIFSRTRH